MNKIEHLGIAVANLEEAEARWTQLLGVAPYRREEVPTEGVRTAFFQVGPNKVELLEATHPESPIAQFIAKRGEGIHHGDLLVVDRSVAPRPGSTVVAVHEGRFVLRRLEGRPCRWRLEASDPHTPAIALCGEDPDLLIWGVVMHAVHHLCAPSSRSRRRGDVSRLSPEALGVQP